MPTYSGHQTPFERRLSLSRLRKEFACLFSTLEEMRIYRRHQLTYRHMILFGAENLKVLSLAIEVSRLRKKRIAASNSHRVNKTKRDQRESHYARLLEQQTELQLSFMQFPPPDDSTVRDMTEKLRRGIMAAAPDIAIYTKEYPDLESIFNRLIHAYSAGNIELLSHLVDQAESITELAELTYHKGTVDRILEKIAKMRTRLEEMQLTFPYILTGRIDREDWIEAEHQRLQKEIKHLESQKSELLSSGC